MKFKKSHNLLFVTILIIFSMQLIGLGVLFVLPTNVVRADVGVDPKVINNTIKPGDFVPQVTIPGSDFKQGSPKTPNGLMIAEYIQAWYKFAVAAVGILAVVMIMAGGLIWLTAGGKADQVSTAKDWIMGAVVGLILALMSYTLLDILNPNLVTFESLDIPVIKLVESGLCCIPDKGPASEEETKKCTEIGGKMCTLLQSCRHSVVDGKEQYSCKDTKAGDSCGDATYCPEGWFCVDGGCYNGVSGAKCDLSVKSCATGYYCVDAIGLLIGPHCFGGEQGDECDPNKKDQCKKPMTCQRSDWTGMWMGHVCR